jgi:hypothetical protein
MLASGKPINVFLKSMFLRHSFAVGHPPEIMSVYVDDNAPPEDRGRIDALGYPPFDYKRIDNAPTLRVTFDPPLSEQAKAGPMSAEALARTMKVGGLAISWTTVPNKDYGKPDLEVAHVSLEQHWSKGLLNQFLNAVEQNASGREGWDG